MKELIQELDYKTFNVILVSRKVYSFQNDIDIVNENCRIINLNFGSLGDFDKKKISKYHQENTKEIKRILKELNFIPNVIHSVYWNSGYLAYELSKFYKINYVHSIISNGKGRNERGAKETAIERFETEDLVFKNAKYLICVAESEKQDLIKFYNINQDKIFVAGQYVHPAFAYPAHNEWLSPRLSIRSNNYAPIRSNDKLDTFPFNSYAFTYVGRLHINKGVHWIIKAWLSLFNKHNPSCPPLWIIGGDATDISNMKKYLIQQKIFVNNAEEQNKLIWWGYLDEPGISALYTKSLCLITNSLYEPGGRVAVEALCQGVPVIASNNGFANDIIKDWQNGFLVSHGDVSNLIKKMEFFIKNPYLTISMRENAIKSGQEIIKFWNFTNKHISLYISAVENTILIPKKIKMPVMDIMDRKINAYPFFSTSVTKEKLFESLKKHFKNIDINSLEIYSNNQEYTSYLWIFACDNSRYICKIPYSRINVRSFFFSQDISLVLTAETRYFIEKMASQKYNGLAPIVYYDDYLLCSVREYYTENSLSLEKIIHSIESVYMSNILPNPIRFKELNSLIKENESIEDINKFYLKECSDELKEIDDYSIRIEILKWYNLYLSLNCSMGNELNLYFNEEIKDLLLLNAKYEEDLSPVLNIGGCDVKNLVFKNQEVMFVDNEHIHWGWPGIDYADYLITYAEKNNLTIQWWADVLSNFSSKFITKSLLVCWLILDCWKKILADFIRYEYYPSKKTKTLWQYLIKFLSQLKL